MKNKGKWVSLNELEKINGEDSIKREFEESMIVFDLEEVIKIFFFQQTKI
jgi:hypothetical protein